MARPEPPPGQRPEVWLRDLLEALEVIDLDPEDVEPLFELLDIEEDEIEHVVTPDPSIKDEGEEARPAPIRPEPAPAGPEPEISPTNATPPRLEPVEPVGRVRPEPTTVSVSDPLEPELSSHYQRPELFHPLLRPEWTPSIVQAATQTMGPGGAVDVPRLVAEIARARPPQRIPRLPRLSMSRGVQLLVDTAEGMEPFIRDQDELARMIAAVVGPGLVSTLFFSACPTRPDGAGPEDFWSWTDYEPPAPATPVVALTDLGLGGPPADLGRARPDEWIALAARLRQRGSRLLIFIPYPRYRWPAGVASAIDMVQWDRSTSRSMIRQLLGRSRP